MSFIVDLNDLFLREINTWEKKKIALHVRALAQLHTVSTRKVLHDLDLVELEVEVGSAASAIGISQGGSPSATLGGSDPGLG